MRKQFCIAFLALLAFALEAFAQSRVAVPIVNFRYRNSHPSIAVTSAGITKGDTISGTTRDTLNIPLMQGGGLAPLGVQIVVYAADADVSNYADSLWVIYRAGIGGTFSTITTTLGSGYNKESLVGDGGSSTYGRTFVFNTTGANVAFNTQAAVVPYMETLQLLLQADDAGDSVRYFVKALGIYEKH